MNYQTYLDNHHKLQDIGLVTKRVFPLPERVLSHPIISKYITSDSRYIITYSGRQSFKSEICKRKLVTEAIVNANYRILIGAPTHGQVKRIYWSGPLNVPDMIPKHFIKDISHSEYRIKLVNGSTIELFSGESPQRAEGSWANLVVLDEAGDMNLEEILYRTVYPMTTPVKGKIWMIGVPRQSMSGFYKELVQKHANDKEWGIYTWPAIDVLDPLELEAVKQQIDPLLFEQEYMGQFHSGYGGLAYTQFDENLHVKPVTYNPNWPLFVACDFNTSVLPWTISQITPDGHINVLDEVVSRNTNIFKQIPLMKEKLAQIAGNEYNAATRGVMLYGDYSGTSESANARGSCWSEIKNMMAFPKNLWKFDVRIKPNPHIDRRIAAVNSRLRTADGKTHISISPNAKMLIRDLSLISWADLNRDKSKLEKQELTHASDGFGYQVNYHYPISDILG